MMIAFGFRELDLASIMGVTASDNKRIARLADWFGAEVVAERHGSENSPNLPPNGPPNAEPQRSTGRLNAIFGTMLHPMRHAVPTTLPMPTAITKPALPLRCKNRPARECKSDPIGRTYCR